MGRSVRRAGMVMALLSLVALVATGVQPGELHQPVPERRTVPVMASARAMSMPAV